MVPALALAASTMSTAGKIATFRIILIFPPEEALAGAYAALTLCGLPVKG
jgi:hypothetical protein